MIYPDLDIGVTSQIETSMIDLHVKLGRPDRRKLEQRLRRGLARFRSQDGVVRVPGLAWVVSVKAHSPTISRTSSVALSEFDEHEPVQGALRDRGLECLDALGEIGIGARTPARFSRVMAAVP